MIKGTVYIKPSQEKAPSTKSAEVITPKEVDKMPAVEKEVKPVLDLVRLETQPSGASVFNGKNELSVTPFEIKLEPDENKIVTIKLNGYKDKTSELLGSVLNTTITLENEPQKTKPKSTNNFSSSSSGNASHPKEAKTVTKPFNKKNEE